uniref:Endonuclease/exonuclease/phosphatase domain-containing protein n=1 Tax=Anopheles epiroticus TaxID=199890 RepID=A0A182PX60_9DIPT
MQRGNFSIHYPDYPTYHHSDLNRHSSTIDIVISNNLHQITTPQTITEFTSDHLPVTFEISLGNFYNRCEKGIPNYSLANWKDFKTYIMQRIHVPNLNLEKITTTEQINIMIAYFSKLISSAHNKFVPLTKHDKYKLIIPDSTLNKIKYRNILRRRWQRNRFTHDLKYAYKTLTKEVNDEITLVRNNAWSTNLEKMNDAFNNSRLWSFVKILKGDSKVTPPIKANGVTLLTSAEKCETLKTQFENANNTTVKAKSPREQQVTQTLLKFFNFHAQTSPKSVTKNLNKGLNSYSKYCKTWKLKINESKTEAIYFSRCT